MSSGPLIEGFTDGYPSYSAGPVAMEAFADGSPPYSSGPLIYGEANADVEDIGDILRPIAGDAYPGTTSAPYRLATKTGVDLTSEGIVHLFVVPTGLKIVVRNIVIRCTAASGITAEASVSGESTNSGTGGIFESRQLYGLTAANKHFILTARGGGVYIDALESIRMVIDDGATGSSQTAEVDLLGYAYNG